MTTTIVITGTGTPVPTPDRAGAGVFIRYEDVKSGSDMHLQFDVGRCTLNRLMAIESGPASLTAVFLTHYHSDHVVGLQDLVLSHWTMDLNDRAGWFDIVAPNGATTRFCERMLEPWDDDLAVRALHNHREPEPRVNLIGFDTPDSPTEVWSKGDVRVLAGPVRHEPVVGAVGYRIETPDGTVAISGDTKVCDEMAELSQGADVVIYEAMRMDMVALRPPKTQYIMEYHADTRLIGAQMAELEIPYLMLTHLIPAPRSPEEEQAFADEVREGGYTGKVTVCADLDTVVL